MEKMQYAICVCVQHVWLSNWLDDDDDNSGANAMLSPTKFIHSFAFRDCGLLKWLTTHGRQIHLLLFAFCQSKRVWRAILLVTQIADDDNESIWLWTVWTGNARCIVLDRNLNRRVRARLHSFIDKTTFAYEIEWVALAVANLWQFNILSELCRSRQFNMRNIKWRFVLLMLQSNQFHCVLSIVPNNYVSSD